MIYDEGVSIACFISNCCIYVSQPGPELGIGNWYCTYHRPSVISLFRQAHFPSSCTIIRTGSRGRSVVGRVFSWAHLSVKGLFFPFYIFMQSVVNASYLTLSETQTKKGTKGRRTCVPALSGAPYAVTHAHTHIHACADSAHLYCPCSLCVDLLAFCTLNCAFLSSTPPLPSPHLFWERERERERESRFVVVFIHKVELHPLFRIHAERTEWQLRSRTIKKKNLKNGIV